jgi:hypothetical protein
MENIIAAIKLIKKASGELEKNGLTLDWKLEVKPKITKYKDRLNSYLSGRLQDKKRADHRPRPFVDSLAETYSANRQRQAEQEIIERHRGVWKDAALSI